VPPPRRPHLLGIDDGPFEKFAEGARAPLVGVMMEGADLVEAVAVTDFPVDGDGITGFLADWIGGRRFGPALQGVLFTGITLAGLAVLDPEALARALACPVLVVNRRRPEDAPLRHALATAGLEARAVLLERASASFRSAGGLWVAAAGASREHAEALVAATRRKSDLPEPLRVAHLVARAVADGESRGRP